MGRDHPQTASAETSICPLAGKYRLLVTRTWFLVRSRSCPPLRAALPRDTDSENLNRGWRYFPRPTSSSRSPPLSPTSIADYHPPPHGFCCPRSPSIPGGSAPRVQRLQ
jgi:hypothetical protein